MQDKNYISLKGKDFEVEDVLKLYEELKSSSKVAKEVGISSRTVRRILSDKGIKRNENIFKKDINCTNCNKTFKRSIRLIGENNFCSRDCYESYPRKSIGFKKDRVGEKHNSWTVLEFAGKNRHSESLWLCRCDCGFEKIHPGSNIVSGGSKSCLECSWKRRLSFDDYISPQLFKIIKNAAVQKERDFNLDIRYLSNLLEEQDFKCALSGEPLIFRKSGEIFNRKQENLSLDRIDNKKGYVKGNVQWTTKIINFMKGIYNNEQFLKACKQVYEYNNK